MEAFANPASVIKLGPPAPLGVLVIAIVAVPGCGARERYLSANVTRLALIEPFAPF